MSLNAKTPIGGICIVTGEASGDLQASLLLKELKKQLPDNFPFWGIGGPLLKKMDFECIYDIQDLAVMGVSEIFGQYLKISRIYKKIFFEIQRRCPKLIILVDYPTGNLKLAERVSQLNFKVIYYIPPKVWSHGLSRIYRLKKYTNLVLCILPFEEKFFRSYGICAKFIGNPLYDNVNDYLSQSKNVFNTFEAVKDAKPLIIGLLPGSRKSEIMRLLPLMIEAFISLKQKLPHAVAKVSIAQNLTKQYVMSVFEQTCLNLKVPSKKLISEVEFVENNTYQILHHTHYAWVCSGTATLEAGFFNTPMSVIYKVSPITAFFARIVIKVKFVSLVNLCLNKCVVPEFLQNNATVKNLVNHAITLINDLNERKQMIQNLAELNKMFPKHSAYAATQEILKQLEVEE